MKAPFSLEIGSEALRGSIAHDVLRHRLILSYEAHGEGIGAEIVIDEIIKQVALP